MELVMMPLNTISPKFVTFTSNPTMTGAKDNRHRDNVEDAAKVTGAAGAGAAATQRAGFRMFKSSKNLNTFVNNVAEGANAINKPIQQSNSLWNAFKLNYKNFKADIATWAKNSKMVPKFIKPLFTGSLGKFIGGTAAVFVFITGVGEVIDTVANNVNAAAKKAA